MGVAVIELSSEWMGSEVSIGLFLLFVECSIKYRLESRGGGVIVVRWCHVVRRLKPAGSRELSFPKRSRVKVM